MGLRCNTVRVRCPQPRPHRESKLIVVVGAARQSVVRRHLGGGSDATHPQAVLCRVATAGGAVLGVLAVCRGSETTTTASQALLRAWGSSMSTGRSDSFRASMIASCDPILFPMYLLAALSRQDTDFLNFMVTGCSPATRPVDFQVNSKRDLRLAGWDAYELKQSTQPGRLRSLGEE